MSSRAGGRGEGTSGGKLEPGGRGQRGRHLGGRDGVARLGRALGLSTRPTCGLRVGRLCRLAGEPGCARQRQRRARLAAAGRVGLAAHLLHHLQGQGHPQPVRKLEQCLCLLHRVEEPIANVLAQPLACQVWRGSKGCGAVVRGAVLRCTARHALPPVSSSPSRRSSATVQSSCLTLDGSLSVGSLGYLSLRSAHFPLSACPQCSPRCRLCMYAMHPGSSWILVAFTCAREASRWGVGEGRRCGEGGAARVVAAKVRAMAAARRG